MFQAVKVTIAKAGIEPRRVTTEARVSVRVLDDAAVEVDGPTKSAARFPMGGATAALSARAHGAPLRVLLVPMRYDVDGSKRLPGTSPARLDLLSSLLRAVYPDSAVELSVHAPVPWTQGLSLTGNVKLGATCTGSSRLPRASRPTAAARA